MKRKLPVGNLSEVIIDASLRPVHGITRLVEEGIEIGLSLSEAYISERHQDYQGTAFSNGCRMLSSFFNSPISVR